MNLSAIRDAIVSEVEEDMDGILGNNKRFNCSEFWKGDEQQWCKDWEPIRVFKKQFKKNTQFLDKLKLSLVCSFFYNCLFNLD